MNYPLGTIVDQVRFLRPPYKLLVNLPDRLSIGQNLINEGLNGYETTAKYL